MTFFQMDSSLEVKDFSRQNKIPPPIRVESQASLKNDAQQNLKREQSHSPEGPSPTCVEEFNARGEGCTMSST